MIIGFRIEKRTIPDGKRIQLMHRVYAVDETYQECPLPSGERDIYRTVEGAQTACLFLTRLFVHPTIQYLLLQDATIMRHVAKQLKEALGHPVYASDIEEVRILSVQRDESVRFLFHYYAEEYHAVISANHEVTLDTR